MAGKQESKQKTSAEKLISRSSAYQALFRSPDGEKVLRDLMRAHAVMSSTFNGNVNDMLIKEGERNVVLRILKLMNVNPQELRERIEEYEREHAEL